MVLIIALIFYISIFSNVRKSSIILYANAEEDEEENRRVDDTENGRPDFEENRNTNEENPNENLENTQEEPENRRSNEMPPPRRSASRQSPETERPRRSRSSRDTDIHMRNVLMRTLFRESFPSRRSTVRPRTRPPRRRTSAPRRKSRERPQSRERPEPENPRSREVEPTDYRPRPETSNPEPISLPTDYDSEELPLPDFIIENRTVIPQNIQDVGLNCHQMSNMCENNLYRTAMARLCSRSCYGADNLCVDRRPDLCPFWVQRNFCNSTFYSPQMKVEYCGRTCGLCHPGKRPNSTIPVPRRVQNSWWDSTRTQNRRRPNDVRSTLTVPNSDFDSNSLDVDSEPISLEERPRFGRRNRVGRRNVSSLEK
ncbi:shK domain-like domain-containing protein [Ditylenchus destructor]|uniref:ShK domain-like domain-containing protein n=1 Tax=Ditylenchus destructor TaxID=166010 RepID=A0AAD4QZF4_9BILA|nr:shK domain-like domain-containing protein [Ditylenchus destructor]